MYNELSEINETLENIYIPVSPTLPKVINMDFAIAKVSTKGQIVIPLSLREDIKTGDEFLVVKDNGRLVFKSMKSLASDLKDDLKFAQKVDDAWKEYDKGKFVKKTKEEFLKELKKW
jgi:AbrB family looped-hinge helix DNA binding protein